MRLGLIAAACTIVTNLARAGTTVDFRFEDRARLLANQEEGGRVYVSDMVDHEVPAPLVVFLHGTNREHRLHRWMRKGPLDLRPVLEDLVVRRAVVPVLLAAPSQTRNADGGATLWSKFDLDAFITETREAVRERALVDDRHVIVVGHSGAGCNASGGLLRIAAEHHNAGLAGIVAIDTCMSVRAGELLGGCGGSALDVYWQPFTWSRDFDAFLDAVNRTRGGEHFGAREIRDRNVLGSNPHYGIVHPAFADALEQLLPPAPDGEEPYVGS